MPRNRNVGDSRYLVEKSHFDVLEKLPPRLRAALANAPYPFSVVDIAVFYEKLKAAGMEIQEAEDLILERFNLMVEGMVKSEVLKNYGPDHPQAGKTENDQERT
jgi:hypothetical protein